MGDEAMHDINEVTKHFAIDGAIADFAHFGNGHINDTYVSSFMLNGQRTRYVHQRINHHVFRHPEQVMENVRRVLSHVRRDVLAAGGDASREVLTLVDTIDGKTFWRSPEGDYWRTYLFVEGSRSHDAADDVRQAVNVARAFALFQKQLSTLTGSRLHETIPDFHHTRKRYGHFLNAVSSDASGRARQVMDEISFITARESDVSRIIDLIESGAIPERICHNDTKFNNVLVDDRTGEGLCVIDLDTVMPGTPMYDFGDLVRMGAATAAEDEPDVSKVGMSLAMFEGLARGYLSVARQFLFPKEAALLAFGARLITLEQGMRFLTDYLEGDLYYKIHHPQHNLDRARTQLAMVADMELKMGEMEDIIGENYGLYTQESDEMEEAACAGG